MYPVKHGAEQGRASNNPPSPHRDHFESDLGLRAAGLKHYFCQVIFFFFFPPQKKV